MKLKLIISRKKNPLDSSGYLLEGSSPKAWIIEFQRLGVNLESCKVYPVPSLLPNALFGCIVETSERANQVSLNKTETVHLEYNKFFLLPQTEIYPQLIPNDFSTNFTQTRYFFHKSLGLVELEEIDIKNLLAFKKESSKIIRKPKEYYPKTSKLKRVMFLINEDDEMLNLESNDSDDPDSPFNKKKILRGDRKEIERFLAALKKDPELALKYGIPLDVLNTARETLNNQKVSAPYLKWWIEDIFDFFKKRRRKKVKKKDPSKEQTKSNLDNGIDLGAMPTGKAFSSGVPKLFTYVLIFMPIVLLAFFLNSAFSSSSTFDFRIILFGCAILLVYIINRMVKRAKNEVKPHTNRYQQTRSNTKRKPAFQMPKSRPKKGSSRSQTIDEGNSGLTGAAVVSIIAILVLMELFGLSFIVALIAAVIIFLLLLPKRNNLSNRGANDSRKINLNKNAFDSIHQRYNKLCDDYLAKKEYEKAAKVQLTLLKNPHRAAEILEMGELYIPAGTVYLKKCNNKEKAAGCYQKGKAYETALELFKELEKYEDIGDLYSEMNENEKAKEYYLKEVERKKEHQKFLEAGHLYHKKLGDTEKAKSTYLLGWKADRDRKSCLNSFINLLPVTKIPLNLRNVFENIPHQNMMQTFIDATKENFQRHPSIQEELKEIGITAISKSAWFNKNLLKELKYFEPKNTNLSNDIVAFMSRKK